MIKIPKAEHIEKMRELGPKPFTLFKYKYNYNNVLVPSHALIRSIRCEELFYRASQNQYVVDLEKIELKDCEAENLIKYMGKQSGIKIVEDKNV